MNLKPAGSKFILFIFAAAVVFFLSQNSLAEADEISRLMKKFDPVWQADHETGNTKEYFWRHDDTACGKHAVVPDPTRRAKGHVHKAEVLCPDPKGDNHRLYPTQNFKTCLPAPYLSTFWVWVDLPPEKERGWVSLATYTNKKNWQDLFGVNLETKNGRLKLVLFHTPVKGKAVFLREVEDAFPQKQWVRIDVVVHDFGLIRVFQNRFPLLSAMKEWGPDGPALCEAHWGLYSRGNTARGVILNDDIGVWVKKGRGGRR